MTRVAVIGAGIAGLTLAREIGAHAEVVVFEKSRGYGGRMATRQAAPYQFDHGAQFFTAKSDEFTSFLQPFIAAGQVARWDAEFVEIDAGNIVSRRHWRDGPPHYVCVPRMSMLARQMALDIDVRLQTRITALVRGQSGWLLQGEDGADLGEFDWVVCAIPAAQAADLLPDGFGDRDRIAERAMLGCYSLMLGFAQAQPLDWQAAFVSNADISWISNDSSKPGRDRGYTLLVHSTNRWAESNIEADAEDVIAHLLGQLREVSGFDPVEADHMGLHRWRYANIGRQDGPGFFVDRESGLGAIGDWCIHGRIEAAFLSAKRLAGELLPDL